MRITLLALLALGLAAPLAAQERPAGRPGAGPRAGRGGGPRDGAPGGMLDRMARRLTDELDLSAEQQAELQEIVTDFRGRMRDRERGPGAGPPPLTAFLDEVQSILTPEQVQKFQPLRERLLDRGAGPAGGFGLRRMIQELPERLALDQTQRAQFDELVAKLPAPGANREEIRPLLEQLRQARRDGDEQRAAQLRRQIAQQRGPGAGAGPPLDQFFSDLEQILREDQKAKLAKIRAEFGPGAMAAGPGEIRGVLQAIRQLDLDSTQRAQVRPLVQEAMRQARALERGDHAGRAAAAQELRQQVLALLRPEQAQQFEKLLAEQKSAAQPGDRPVGRQPREIRRQPRTPPDRRP